MSTIIHSITPTFNTIIFPIVKGVHVSNMLNMAKRNEDTIRQGRNKTATACLQIAQVSAAWTQTSEIFTSLKAPIISVLGNIFAVAIPSAVAYAATKIKDNFTLKKIVNFVHDHIGTLAHIITVITSIALIAFFNQPIIGITSLVCLGIGILDRQGILPEKLRHIIHQSGFIIGNITGLIVGDILNKIIALADIVVTIANKIFEYKANKELEKVRKENANKANTEIRQITKAELDTLDNELLRIRKEHIEYELPIPYFPKETDISELETICDKLDDYWEKTPENSSKKYKDFLLDRLMNDQRYCDVAVCEEKYRENPILYIKDQLKIYIKNIKTRGITAGEPLNYQILDDYSKFITFTLSEHIKKGNYVEVIDQIIILGVDGGHYCGPEVIRATETVFHNLLGQVLDLKEKILFLLQTKRRIEFEHLYEEIWNATSFNRKLADFFDSRDVHEYNIAVNLIGSDFGLHDKSAEQDTTALVQPLMKFLLSKFLKPLHDQFWNRGYTAKQIMDTVSEQIGSTFFPKPVFIQWWKDWVNRQQDLSAYQKEQACEDLDMHVLFGDPMEEIGQKMKFKKKFLKAMLIEMGVLNVQN